MRAWLPHRLNNDSVINLFCSQRIEKLMNNSVIIIGLLYILTTLSTIAAACPIDLPTTTVSINGHLLTVELATTPASRGCGLSHRPELPKNQGMLFVFSDLRPRNFWMKDTFIALSIAYLDNSGQIFSLQDMVPLQTDEQYPSSRPAAYALEVNQGWFHSHGIDVGDVVEMKLPLVLDIR
jgi:uncharacterized membrane protein (UPF0127 family)